MDSDIELFVFNVLLKDITCKVWGKEYLLVNTESYCAKILLLLPDHHGSLHSHNKKDETFIVLKGAVTIESFINGNYTIERYAVGDKLRIPPTCKHRFFACTNEPVYILEVSTHHEDSDTYRVKGCESG